MGNLQIALSLGTALVQQLLQVFGVIASAQAAGVDVTPAQLLQLQDGNAAAKAQLDADIKAALGAAAPPPPPPPASKPAA